MNSSENANKQVCHDLFARFTAGDIDGVMDLLAADATWRIPGKPEASRAAGDYDKDRLRALFHRIACIPLLPRHSGARDRCECDSRSSFGDFQSTAGKHTTRRRRSRVSHGAGSVW